MTRPPHEIPVSGPAPDFAARLRAALPRLETDRLVLRAPRLEDFAIYWEIYSRRDSEWVVDDPSRTGAWLDFAQMAGGWLLRGHGAWAVETRGGETVGFVLVGLEPGDLEPELGYFFRAEAEGQGYAMEAALAARAHAFEAMGLASLVSTIDPGNAASQRLAERMGAIRDAQAEAAHAREILVYRHQVGSA